MAKKKKTVPPCCGNCGHWLPKAMCCEYSAAEPCPADCSCDFFDPSPEYVKRLESVLTEFCADVEAVGLDYVSRAWPDLEVTYAKAKALTGPGLDVYVCQNGCGEFDMASVRVWLKDIPDLCERLSPGETVPACECPMCGALAHRKEDEDGSPAQGQRQKARKRVAVGARKR